MFAKVVAGMAGTLQPFLLVIFILRLSKVVDMSLNSVSFSKPHSKKSGGVISGDWGDQATVDWKRSIFWDIRQCSPVKVNRRFVEYVASILRVVRNAKQETSVKAGDKQSHSY
jgi:hypothetical protein